MDVTLVKQNEELSSVGLIILFTRTLIQRIPLFSNYAIPKWALTTALRAVFPFVFLFVPHTLFSQEIVRQFEAPGPEVRGLAWDGRYLWCADAEKDSIFKVDPVSGQAVHAISFDLDETSGGGITWSGDEVLWVTRMQYFYKIDAYTGQQLADLHCYGG